MKRVKYVQKKILFISHMYPAKYDKSYGKVIHEQAISLVKKGHVIKVICPIPFTPPFFQYLNKKYYNFHQLPEKEVHDGIEVYYPRYISLPRSLLMSYSGTFMFNGIFDCVKNLRESFDFDVIHAHFGLPDGFAAMRISKHFKRPLVTTLQSTDLDSTVYRNKKCKNKVHEVLKYSSEVITPTPRLQNQLSNIFNINSQVIGYGIDLTKIKSEIPKKLSLKYRNEIIIISVSRLINTKGIEYNLQAVKELKKEYSNIRYLIIGDGPEKENLEKLTMELKLSNSVEFLGEINQFNVMEYIAISDIFSLPSWQETFGLVYLEAMANEIPVIGCIGQGFDGIIRHEENGYLANPKDVPSIISIIDHIIKNPVNSKKVALKGAFTAFNNFTFDKIAIEIDDIYDQVLEI